MLYHSSKTIFGGRAPKEIVCEPCFVDYQSAVIGILRNKASSEERFPREGINLSGIVNSVNGNFLIDEICFVSFRFAEYRKPFFRLVIANLTLSVSILVQIQIVYYQISPRGFSELIYNDFEKKKNLQDNRYIKY